jgi:hypothetical protein
MVASAVMQLPGSLAPPTAPTVAVAPGRPDAPPRARLLGAVDYAAILALMALGLGLRLVLASGFGLDDDLIFRHNIASVVQARQLIGDNVSYRLTWLLPTALSAKALGLTEVGMILPVTVFATLAIGLLYAFGKLLWGRTGAVLAALLLIVHPLDFTWSTMLSNDIPLSVCSALAMFLVVRATRETGPLHSSRRWILAGVAVWLAFQAKVSGVLILPAIAVVCWQARRRLDAGFLDFVGTVVLLFGTTALAYYLYRDDPLAPYSAELKFQGLVGPDAAAHRVTSMWFWTFPQLLFLPDRLGDLLFSIYPHLLVALALASPLLGIRTSPEVFWWFLFVFLGMQFNMQRAEGVFITGFRNVRHGHVFVYPLILLLTGYLTTLRARFPRLGTALIAIVLAVSAWQSVATASKTHATFNDMRQACRFLTTLPPKVIYSDAKLPTWCAIVPRPEGWSFRPLHDWDRAQRQKQLALIESGYLVTGGGREPYYGCRDCVIEERELPPGRFRLLFELPGPTRPEPWRLEALRIWEAVPSAPPVATP